MPEPRPAVVRMAPYSPPVSGREGKLRLDFNENTVGCSPRVVRFLTQKLSEEGLSVYPEYEETRSALSAYFKVSTSRFTLTNGTDEAIQLLINTYVDDGQEVVLLHPSYAMYRFYAEVAGAHVVEVSYPEEDLAFPTEKLLETISPATRAILIANPNNPTGSAVALSDIVRILDHAPQAAVLIDEAYFEFHGVTAIPLIDRFPNLFVSRTFSKAFGMAALRIGCLFSSEANVSYLRKAQSPYSVNMLAAIAVRAAVEDTAYVDEYARNALEARDLLYEGFQIRNIRFYRSQGNFVLFHAGQQAAHVRDEMRKRGVLVRDRSYEIPGTVRVTAGTRPQVDRFFAALDEVWR